MARPNIGLIETQRDEGETSLSFDIAWSPPSIVNGALTEYELALSSLESGSTPALYQFTYPVSVCTHTHTHTHTHTAY